jgi:hypothetical protein
MKFLKSEIPVGYIAGISMKDYNGGFPFTSWNKQAMYRATIITANKHLFHLRNILRKLKPRIQLIRVVDNLTLE